MQNSLLHGFEHNCVAVCVHNHYDPLAIKSKCIYFLEGSTNLVL